MDGRSRQVVFKLGGFSASGENIYASVIENDGWDCGTPLAANVERMPPKRMERCFALTLN